MKVQYPITLDVKKTNVQKIIHANQGEGLDRKLIITLVSGNDKLILDDENQSAQFVAKKPDDTTIYNTAKIKDGKVIVYLTTQTTAAVGDVDCQLEIVSTDTGSVANGVVYSAKFTIAVEEALYDTETITSSNEFTELIELIERAEKQVTVFSGYSSPGTNPSSYEGIKATDFYYSFSEQKYYYAKSVSTTIEWETLVNNTMFQAALDTIDDALDLKADKSTTYNKTEVDEIALGLGNTLSVSIDPSTYVMTLSLKHGNSVLSTGTVDLPLETMVVDADYDSETKEIVLTLQSGATVRFSVAALVSGLVSTDELEEILADYVTEDEIDSLLEGKQDKIDSSHKISADNVDDTNATNKFVTLQDKTKWNDNTPRLFIDNSHSTPTTNPSDYPGVKEGDFLVSASYELYACRYTTDNYVEWNKLANTSDLSSKQDKLIPGANIHIAADGKTISATGGGSDIKDTAKGTEITLTDSAAAPLSEIYINGKSTQTGTPTIDSPIPIVDTTSEEIEITNGDDTQSAELDITLRGIPVSSGGNYTDENNQQWLCDTIERYSNGSGKYIKRVNALTLNGSETWTTSGAGRVAATLNIPNSISTNIKTICDSLQLVATGNDVANTDNAYIIANGRMLCSPTQNGARLSNTQWITFLATNNATLYHPLDTPIETPLTAEELAELNLSTYYPQTEITSNAGLIVEYVADTKNWIDNNFVRKS